MGDTLTMLDPPPDDFTWLLSWTLVRVTLWRLMQEVRMGKV
jgi:hypothetical protein